MGGAQHKDLQSLLTELTSGSRIRSESKHHMGKYPVQPEQNRFVAGYTRYNSQAGREYVENYVVR